MTNTRGGPIASSKESSIEILPKDQKKDCTVNIMAKNNAEILTMTLCVSYFRQFDMTVMSAKQFIHI